jgi:hypothetical protein
MTVDVIDWHTISDEFKAVIEKSYEIIQKKALINLKATSLRQEKDPL